MTEIIDTSDIPEADEDWFQRARLIVPRVMVPLPPRLLMNGKCIQCGQPPDLCVCDGTRTGARLDNSGKTEP
jgi:hypothetical protein